MLQSELKKFAQQVILDKVDELEKSCSMPTENVRQLAEMGILGAIIPEDLGGVALELIGLVVSLEEISKICASTATIVATHNAFFAYPLLTFGNDTLKKKYLPAAAKGEIIGGFAGLQTNQSTLTTADTGFIVNGSNPFVLNAESNGAWTAFLPLPEENSTPIAIVMDAGVNVERKKSNSVMGLKSAGIGTLTFEDLMIPESSIIGTKEQGKMIVTKTHDYANICFAAILLGIAQGALDEAIKYAKERVQFEQTIINFGMVREKIALMATHIEASRLLVYNAATQCDDKKNYRHAAAMAKYFAGQCAIETTTQAIQVFGGYGYMKDYPVERFFRDAQVVNVIGGTPYAQKEIIASETIG